ncbi:lipase 1-like [Ochlerotatus camptorhynchus]|uniref:lipase 1-like n=1 Tax=Ochlerotatus camptorhynchus TaxID=644619 RepID=UPI0031E16E8C
MLTVVILDASGDQADKMKRSGRGRTEYYIKRHGITVERYNVTTDDGYQLRIFRLLPKVATRGVALLQHGIRQSSANWLALNRNLPLQLLDEGIEVWLANTRASTEGSTHISLSSSSAEFWDFSFHEFGYFDLPAIVDTILVISRWKRIHVIAFSQGAAAVLIFLTKRPMYSKMIASLNLLAPAVIMANSRWTMLAVLYITFKPILPWSLQRFVTGSDEFYGNSQKELVHFQLLMLSGRFLAFDYGPKANLELYGSSDPPEYPLGKVSCPVTLHYGGVDRTVHPKDVKRLSTLFSGSASVDMFRYNRMDHLDFLIRQEASSEVYPSVVYAVVKQL